MDSREWPELHGDFLAHAQTSPRREVCGLVVIVKGRPRYIPCTNIAENDAEFVLNPREYAAAEDMGDVVASVHSHIGIPAIPSMADLSNCEATGLPGIVVNGLTGAVGYYRSTGYRAALSGRPYAHGIHDCWTLVRDYYREELGLTLPEFTYPSHFWEKGLNLYAENFESAGFVQVPWPPQRHDALLMGIKSDVPNHAAVYLGDERILHHPEGRLSGSEPLSAYWQRSTLLVVRHLCCVQSLSTATSES